MKPVDLKATFGRQFKLGVDPSYRAERADLRAGERPWLRMILCRHGEIVPWGGSMLAAVTRSAGPVANRLRALPVVKVVQNGTDGITATFDVADFDQVAEVMLPRKRRHLSADARAAAGERLRQYQFQPAVGFDYEAESCVPSANDDS